MKKTRMKLAILWGVIITAVIVVINGLHHLFEGGERESRMNGFRQGRWEGAGHFANQGGMGHRQFMYGPHHGGEFHWLGLLLFLIIGLAVLVLLVKWLRRRANSSTMSRFVESPMVDSYTPVINHDSHILDEWEKNVLKNKEDE